MAMKGYALSKLCNVIFAKGLQREFERVGSHVVSVSLHPGANIRTEFGKHVSKWIYYISKYIIWPIYSLSLEEGAQTTIFCVVANDLVPGGYYDDCKLEEENTLAKNEANIEKLWRISDDYVKEYLE
jgi:NAD(P)-dependent dehydrogenase (short-subunit alcohol dehydrogenase family)